MGYGIVVIDLWRDSVLRPNELPFTTDDLSQFSCPTLTIHSDRDPLFPLTVPLAMYQAIPNAELCVIPNCGHNITRENSEMFHTALAMFLERQTMNS